MIKKTIAALLLTAAAATPAMASYRQAGAITPSPAFAYNETAKGKPYRAPTSIEYGTTASAWHKIRASQHMAYRSEARASSGRNHH